MTGKPLSVLMVVAVGLLAVGLGGVAAQETPLRVPASELESLDVDVVCPVSDVPHRNQLHAARYRGRIFYTCDAGALERFLRNPGAFLPERAPRAGLFRSPNPAATSYGIGWFVFGLYMVLGLVCGALAAYVAVQKGLGGVRWFVAGLALNAIGVVLVLLRPARTMQFTRPGLAKIPTTHDPVPCPRCGEPGHPSATSCSSCGAALEPSVESEVARVVKGGR